MMTQSDNPFGNQLYEAFRTAGRLDLLTGRFNYDAIQRLKEADRARALKLFMGSPWEVLQRLKTDSPDEIIEYFISIEQQNAKAAHCWILPQHIALLSLNCLNLHNALYYSKSGSFRTGLLVLVGFSTCMVIGTMAGMLWRRQIGGGEAEHGNNG